MINNSYDENYIEIEDFGDLTVFQFLRKKKENKLFYYKKILLLLKKIQKVKTKKIKTFINTQYKIPNYSKEKLINMGIFEDNSDQITLIEWPEIIKNYKTNNIIDLNFEYDEEYNKRFLTISSNNKISFIDEFE